jgi:hypothetical protein
VCHSREARHHATSNDIVMHRGDDFVKPAHGHITTASLLCGPVHTMTCYACLYEYTSCLITALLICCCLACSCDTKQLASIIVINRFPDYILI